MAKRRLERWSVSLSYTSNMSCCLTISTDGADVASILIFEWQPRPGREDEVLDFYETGIGPMFSMAPEIMRLRWFKIHDAVVLKDDVLTTLKSKDYHTYMSIAEMKCEEWPWGEIFELNDLPQWADLFEDQKAVVR